MTSPANGQQPSFQVTLAGQAQQTIKESHQYAAELGQGKQFLDSLRFVYARLRTDPHSFGEPLFRLPTLKLLVACAIVPPVIVHFGVHQEEPLVIIRHVRFLG